MQYCVHIGYAKAGSTYLQRQVFSGDHPDIDIVGGTQSIQSAEYQKSGVDLFLDNSLGHRRVTPFAFDPEKARAELAQLPDSGKPVRVISNEELAGHPYSGGVYAETMLQRIQATLPDAKILIVVREQRKMLLSAFADFMDREAGRCSLQGFLHSPSQTQIPWHNPNFYCFSPLVSAYRTAFGEANVLVLPLELLEQDNSAALRRITSFLNVREYICNENEQRNVRDYRRYAAIRMNPAINLFGRRRPANGNANFSVPVLNKLLMQMTKLVLPRAITNAVVRADLEAIEAHLLPYVPSDNAVLQQFVPDDLKRLGYMLN